MSSTLPARAPGAVAEVLAWWAAATGVWLLTLSSVNAAELVVALACGLLCGVAARAGRIALGQDWRVLAGWAGWLGPLAVSAVSDAARVLVLAFGRRDGAHEAGRLVEVPLTPGHAPGERSRHRAEDPEDVARGRAAMATLVVSASPGTLVVEDDPGRRTLTVHSLVPPGSALERAVRR
jgi:multisubunit Na+/H+ antiporter MnhE subunit